MVSRDGQKWISSGEKVSETAESAVPKMAGYKIYGEIRSEICRAYIAAGQPKPAKNWLYSRLVETSFKLRALEESNPQPETEDAYGCCEYSAIHRDTAHFREPGCVNWRPL